MGAGTIEEQVQRLYQLAIDEDISKRQEWVEAVKNSDLDAVAAVFYQLGTTGHTGAKLTARREAARIVIESRLFKDLIDTMKTLDRSASRLSVVGVVASVVLGIAAILVAVL